MLLCQCSAYMYCVLCLASCDGTRWQDSLLHHRWSQAEIPPLLPRRHLALLNPTSVLCLRMPATQDEVQPPPKLRWLETCRPYQSTVPLGGGPHWGQARSNVTPAHRRLRARSGERRAQPCLPCEACVSVCCIQARAFVFSIQALVLCYRLVSYFGNLCGIC